MANPLVAKALEGDNRQLTLLGAQGMLPLPVEELIPLQIELATSDDDEIADVARQALAQTESRVITDFVSRHANEAQLSFFAARSSDNEVLEAIIRRRDVPGDLLASVASRLSADLQESLLLRQDLIVDHPEILDALEDNENLSSYAKRRVAEYRRHLLGEAPDAPGPGEPAEKKPDDEAVQEAIEAVRDEPAEGEIDEITGLSESQIRLLPVPVRRKLTRGASRSLRSILIRDSNKTVALAVLESNPMSDSEIEQIARSRSVIADVVEQIAQTRQWVSKYPIMHALVTNPKTPTGVAVRLLSRLSVRDLQNLARDRNVPAAVRSRAKRLHRVKSA